MKLNFGLFIVHKGMLIEKGSYKNDLEEGPWIRFYENGEISYPVNECTIAGNLRDMLLGIIPGNDGRAHLSRVVPSLLVPGMAIAGE